MNSRRPVWVGVEHVRFLNRLTLTPEQRALADDIVDQWDAAPADAAEAASNAVTAMHDVPSAYDAHVGFAVLAALGMPASQHATRPADNDDTKDTND